MSVWDEAKRGDVWVDAKKREHLIVGVVDGGFDSMCEGQPENFRDSLVVGSERDAEFAAAEVEAKGGNRDAQKEAFKAAFPKWVDLDDASYAAVEGWKRKGA